MMPEFHESEQFDVGDKCRLNIDRYKERINDYSRSCQDWLYANQHKIFTIVTELQDDLYWIADMENEKLAPYTFPGQMLIKESEL